MICLTNFLEEEEEEEEEEEAEAEADVAVDLLTIMITKKN